MIEIEKVKELRELTSLSVIDCKKALEEAGGDLVKAQEILKKAGVALAEKKSARVAGDGLIYSYIHNTGKIGVLLELSCETDFVARNEEFKSLAHEICLQVASLAPKSVEELLKMEYIKDSSRTIQDLVTVAVSKLGENINIRRFLRYQVAEDLTEKSE